MEIILDPKIKKLILFSKKKIILTTNMLQDYETKFTLNQIPSDLDVKDKIIYSLVEKQANDLNSSTFREDISLRLIGYENSSGKLGYDGFDASANRQLEVKPKNFTGKSKLSGQGNFTDYTWKRLQKYTDDNVKMVVSGFHYGKIAYILEFDFCEEQFQNRLKTQLTKRFPEGDVKGQYLRSASFGWNHFNECKSLTLKYISPHIETYKAGFTRTFYKFLLKLPKV